jgi:leader peptidase (prepilin peptidase)/N-methyltransferase
LIPIPVLLGIVGLAVGSFLNVVIVRLPDRKSLVWPGSACPKCGHPIRWYDNIPLAGWLMLRGRCRDCHAPIALRYPIVEAVTAAAFVACYWVIGLQWLLVPRAILAAALIALFAIDLELQLLPDRITLPGILTGLVFSMWFPPGFRDAAYGVLLGGGVLWMLGEAWSRLRHVDAMGGGDVKMLAMIGAFLGWKMVVVTFVVSSILGGLFAAALLVTRRTTLTSALPFGTFLAIAGFVASLWGESLMHWYLSMYQIP